MTATQHFDIFWYGPFDDADDEVLRDENLVLYMLTGTHGLYGKSVPLYIGKTLRTVKTRVCEHKWIQHEPDPVRMYAAAISPPFEQWSEIAGVESYPPLADHTVTQIESLLIFAHQPVYNARSKGDQCSLTSNICLFNTGRRATLYPEVSSLYWYR
jgi:hypothetical protein